jgi:hypothetical protein
MKAIGGVGVLLCLGLFAFWLSKTSNDTENAAVNIPFAFGKPSAGQLDMHIIVGVALANVSRSREPLTGKDKNWNEWVKEHLIVKDLAGKTVPLTRQTSSNVVKPHEVAQMVGTEEFFVVARLKTGQTYTLDYIGDLATGKTYRCQFTTPSQAEKSQQYRLEPVNSGR